MWYLQNGLIKKLEFSLINPPSVETVGLNVHVTTEITYACLTHEKPKTRKPVLLKKKHTHTHFIVKAYHLKDLESPKEFWKFSLSINL